MMASHLSLFSGIGGLDLAAEWAGFETVGQCEFADYPTKILEKHWPDVPRWRDIRTLTKESFYERTGRTTVDVISGGFPCQPFSVAGKQKGKGDDRYLWPEMLRVIRELTPSWVVGENVPGIIKIAGKTICEDLEREGYAVTVFNFEAAAVGAPHRRDRVFFVGWNSEGNDSGKVGTVCSRKDANTGRICQNVANAESTERTGGGRETRERRTISGCGGWWSTEPDVGRVATGIPSWMDRLKCLGNAVVPQQAYLIFKAIMEVIIWLSRNQPLPA